MLLAAGRGERLRPITDGVPKALVEVRGKSLIEHHLEALADAGIVNVVINLGWHGEQIAARVGSGSAYGLTVAYSPEGEHILETGGGIVRALPLLGGDPFLVANADVYTDIPRSLDIADDRLGHLVLVPRPDFKEQGDFGLENGTVSNPPLPEFTFSGVAVYRPQLFDGLEDGRFPLAPLLREAADRGCLSGEIWRGGWQDVGTPERLAAANET